MSGDQPEPIGGKRTARQISRPEQGILRLLSGLLLAVREKRIGASFGSYLGVKARELDHHE
jgi:hypothetical protein